MKRLNREVLARWYKLRVGSLFHRNLLRIELGAPLISFTFDDFPETALSAGGEILRSFGVVGTYYVSLGLLNADSPSGLICSERDVIKAWEEGHEIGSHTFSHCHSWDTANDVYESNIKKNSAALQKLVPGAIFKTFSYPISLPRPALKQICRRYFVACRGGGQKVNSGSTDLNQLSAYFLEKTRDDFSAIERIVDENAMKRGWLIFATHDVSATPSPYGCTPDFFRKAVKYSLNSGARILPVVEAIATIRDGGRVAESRRLEAISK